MTCPEQKAIVLQDPRYKALQTELMGMNTRLDAIINQSMPKAFVLDIKTISKATTFSDTEIECGGFDLIKISTDGDLTDVSFKIIQLDGAKSLEVEASELPQFLGPVSSVLITNDTAETGKTITITRIQAASDALAALQHGTPTAVSIATSKRMFYAEIEEYTSGADNYFETEQTLGDLPTLSFVGTPAALHIRVHTIKWQISPTAAETYQLYLFERASENDEQQESDIFFDTGPGMVGGKIYTQVPGGSPAKLPIDVVFGTPGEIPYLTAWSGSPGNSTGYIKVYGEVLG